MVKRQCERVHTEAQGSIRIRLCFGESASLDRPHFWIQTAGEGEFYIKFSIFLALHFVECFIFLLYLFTLFFLKDF